jgi:hypothetical protein
MDFDSHVKNKHPQEANTDQLLQGLSEELSSQTLIEEKYVAYLKPRELIRD